MLSALVAILRERDLTQKSSNSPWAMRDGWRLNATYKRTFVFAERDRERIAVVEYRGKDYRISIGQARYSVSGMRLARMAALTP